MKHRQAGWLSDICLCGKEFKDRMEFYKHSAKCETQIMYRKASGVTTS